ncbi:MAG: PQQ-binding-like beta-propeller repeat protein [Trebonia sp.]
MRSRTCRRRFGAVIALTGLLSIAACSSSPSVPSSPLNGSSALTCATGSHGCTAPGTVRWSVPLGGSTQFDVPAGGSVLNMPAAHADQISYSFPDGYLAEVAVAPDLVVFQHGKAAAEAVNPVTGKLLWNKKLPLPPGFSPEGSPPDGALDLELTVANGEVSVYDQTDYLWWLVNAATGAASPPHRLAAYSRNRNTVASTAAADVVPVNAGNAVLLNLTNVQDVDPATGAVRWQVPVRPWTGEAVIGSTLYLDNDRYAYEYHTNGNNSPSGAATAVQRVDLTRGRALPGLPLPASLHGEDGQITQYSVEPGALMVVTSAAVARISPATGQAMWLRPLPSGALGTPQPGSGTASPSIEYLVRGDSSDSGDITPPVPGTGKDVWRVQTISLATGDRTSIAPGRSFPYGAAGIQTAGSVGVWSLVGSSMLAADATPAKSAGNGIGCTRLEAVDPRSGRVSWRGPVAGDVNVPGQTLSDPPLVIAESCAPSGLAASSSSSDTTCDSERLYAINT